MANPTKPDPKFFVSEVCTSSQEQLNNELNSRNSGKEINLKGGYDANANQDEQGGNINLALQEPSNE